MSDQELLDVFDENNKPIGQVLPRGEVHEKGLWHRATHLFFVNSKEEILLQLRSASKVENPNKWHVTVAGHIPSGQTPMQATIEEAKEEIGVDINEDDIQLVKIMVHESYREFVYVYLSSFELDLNTVSLNLEEVADLRYFTKSQIIEMVRSGEMTSHLEEYLVLFSFLEDNR